MAIFLKKMNDLNVKSELIHHQKLRKKVSKESCLVGDVAIFIIKSCNLFIFI